MASDESDFDDDFDDDDIGGKRREDGDDFEFGESFGDSPAAGSRNPRPSSGGEGKSQHLQNQPFDEAVDLSDEDSLGTSIDTIDPQNSPSKASLDNKVGNNRLGGGGRGGPGGAASSSASASSKRGDSPPRVDGSSAARDRASEYPSSSDDERGGSPASRGKNSSAKKSSSRRVHSDSDQSATGEEDDDEEEDSADDGLDESQDATPGKAKRVKGEYDPADYAHLNVSAEVRDLWNYIGRYKPHNIELETKLKCFIPDYIPAVGEIDAFIKVPPPSKEEEGEQRLGLKVLDEPASHQSDPTVLDLQLRAISKKSNLEPMVVRSLEYADKNPREIQRWVESINDLHREKPRPQVYYTKTMPDIEHLMQVWPDSLEEMLKTVKLPPPAIDLEVQDYARVLCALFDIPVRQNVTESLHVLFTLYSAFINNQHFMNLGDGEAAGSGVSNGTSSAAGGGAGGADIMTVTAAELAMFDGAQRK